MIVKKREGLLFRDFIRKEKALVSIIAISVIVCWGQNAFTNNVRIDGEVFINNPGTLQGWLSVGRFGMLPVKYLLGNLNFNPYFSGAVFIVLFSAVCILWAYLITSIIPDLRYLWVFAILYVSSNTWAYMFYFTMMSAEIAFALLIIAVSLIVFTKQDISRSLNMEVPRVICILLLIIAFGCYQAIVPVFISGAAICILLWLNREADAGKELSFKAYFAHSLRYIAPFAAAFILYSLIAGIWFTSGDYLTGMSMWQSHSFLTCLIIIAGRIGQTLGGSPNLYSFAFPVGCFLCLGVYLKEFRKNKLKHNLPLYEFTCFVLLLSPFIILIRLGGQMIPRMQFSLQLVSAFMCMYALNKIDRKYIRAAAAAASVAVVLFQFSVVERLYYTDDIREKQDEALAFEICSDIGDEYSDSGLPVVFVGRKDAKLNNACLKTDVFGASLFSWDYNSDIPSLGSHRSAGFIKALTGIDYPEPSEEQKIMACVLAKEMPSYPQEGYIAEKDGILIVKLSD